jgi:thiol-disulfide isomerase/thioredoxin
MEDADMFHRIFSQVFSPSCLVVVGLCLAGSLAQAQEKPDPVEVSIQRLKVIHKALVEYKRTNKHWPDHLSDLVPDFLPNRDALRDPADPGTGDLGSNLAHKDPMFPVSYSYERNAKMSNGLPSPLGPFPEPDAGHLTGWGTWRLVNGHQEYFYGDQVPLVRCYLHRPAEEDREDGKDLVLNLTPSGRVYRSDFDWESHPDSIAFMLRTLLRDLTQGAEHVCRNWQLFRVREHIEAADVKHHAELMRSLAPALFAVRDQLPDGQRAACKIVAGLSIKLGDFEPALAALEACPKYPGSDSDPIVEDQMRAEAYHGLKQWNKEIAVYEGLLQKRPNVRPYMTSLAEAYAAAGKPEKAEEWRKKADPGALLVGNPAPDFHLSLFEGNARTLGEARQGKKALLVNFWFCGCPPCRLEFPHLQKLYTDYKAKGLEILAVNYGDDKEAIRKFLGGKYNFPIAMGKESDNKSNPIFAAYHISEYPTTYLIDGEGKVVWRGIGFGPDWKRELPEALAKLGL